MDVNQRDTNQDYTYWCRLLHQTTHLSVLFYNDRLSLQMAYPETSFIPPSLRQLLERLTLLNEPSNIPVWRRLNSNEQVVTLVITDNEQPIGLFILGPCLDSAEVEPNSFTNGLPVFSRQDLLHVAVLATSILTTRRLSTSDVVLDEDSSKRRTTTEDTKTYERELFKNRQDIAFHATYQSERMTLRCVKEGQKEELLQRLASPDRDGRIGVLSKQSTLRNEKNLHISTITLATRYAIEGGLHPETAYTMSDHYIQGAEELRTIEAVQRYTKEALCEFTDQVNKSKQLRHSAPIIKCQSYVFKHLYDAITLQDVARFVNLHPNYLSSLFKKEVGLSFTEYVLREKIAEAKKLLKYTDSSLSEIYTWLNFHDQSHFTKVFKTYTGTTPKQFKQHEHMPTM
ncbi:MULTISPECIES: helix-turn-helix domain-containing protein [unclassified Exiguobacterium]|uniref:helix-turn-helix domain-containing protein n=1 Tax=unclassified Exiguobacterium TaxID=2644629 RepID=UPI001BE77D3B|nr:MULTISPECIES: helix-turn-helix domain-containing protein [unclassified Exiguobacterium]